MRSPAIGDDDFLSKLAKKYEKYKIPASITKKSVRQLCKPDSGFTLQYPQRFMSEFMGPASSFRGILIFHKIGSGKTCTAISIAERWKGKRNIIVVVPASLIGNFRDELRSQCAGQSYLTDAERRILNSSTPEQRERIIRTSDARIDKEYSIMSYNKFVDVIDRKKLSLKNTLLIIDEIQNVVSETGSYYAKISEYLRRRAPPDLRVVLLSATPIFDKPVEIALTLNLLRLKDPFPVGVDFYEMFITEEHNDKGIPRLSMKNQDEFARRVQGYVSYYRGMPAHTFPKVEFKVVRCVMHPFQLKAYNTVIKAQGIVAPAVSLLTLPTNFFLGGRMISNIAYPNLQPSEEGYTSWTGKNILLENVGKFSCKIARIVKRLRRSPGKSFVYSNFLAWGGLRPLAAVLETIGYRNFKDFDPLTDKRTQKYYAIWSGSDTLEYKEQIKHVFNDPDSRLTIMLGSPAIKEGVSFKRVRQVHILEPYWNMARLQQIMGRAIRYCSHADLPPDEQVVKVFLYQAVRPNENDYADRKNILQKMTIDRYIHHLALSKQSLIEQFETVLKANAVDCHLNKNANRDPFPCAE